MKRRAKMEVSDARNYHQMYVIFRALSDADAEAIAKGMFLNDNRYHRGDIILALKAAERRRIRV